MRVKFGAKQGNVPANSINSYFIWLKRNISLEERIFNADNSDISKTMNFQNREEDFNPKNLE
jgi:hypothetical protein